MEDCVESCETIRGGDDGDLHFRMMGTAQDRQFVVNIQCDSAASDSMGDKLRPEEYDFMIARVLRLVLERLTETPNSALH